MVVRRVKLLLIAPVLAVLLACGGRDVDEPMKWRNAWDIPFNFSMPLDSTVYDAVHSIMNENIAGAVPELNAGGEQGSDELSSIILGDTSNIMGNIMDDDFSEQLRRFMTGDSAVLALLEKNNLDVDSVAAEVSKSVEGIQQEVETRLNVPFSMPAQSVPALDMDFFSEVNKVSAPRFTLVNGTPLDFTLHVLFSNDADSPINYMDDDGFLGFIMSGGCESDAGCISLKDRKNLGSAGMRIDNGKTLDVDFPADLGDWLREFIMGRTPLAWRWMAVIDGGPGKILGALGGKGREYHVDVELGIHIEVTNKFDF